MRVEFRHPAVRDLAWVIASPPLLREGAERIGAAWCRVAFYDRIPWLREVDHHPHELEQWLAEHHSPLLGHYFEALVEFWLRHWRRIDRLAARVPLNEGERPLGEFDFLFHDRFSGTTLHWETAVKFFLRHPTGTGGYAWLGPNPRDTLQKKLTKVFSRQLRLGALVQAKPLLHALQLETPSPFAYIKGYLFYPCDTSWREASGVPEEISAQHLRGWWCRLSQAETIPQQNAASRWLSLPRLRWCAPARAEAPEQGWDRATLLASLPRHFARDERPLLLAELQPGSDGVWREVSRGFVVPEAWPRQRRHSPHDASDARHPATPTGDPLPR